jgi:hypothetical protein
MNGCVPVKIDPKLGSVASPDVIVFGKNIPVFMIFSRFGILDFLYFPNTLSDLNESIVRNTMFGFFINNNDKLEYSNLLFKNIF